MSLEFRAVRAAFLGIERSLTGRRWAARLGDERMALAMAQRHGLPDAICRLLAAREVELEDVPDFLEPTLRKFLPDPSHLKDMDTAVARIVRAVRDGEKIVVFGDYDVDGATSSALLPRFFRAVGGNVAVYIPDRRKEGYGPNTPALLRLKEQGAAVVITVDCGVTAFEPLAEARRAGLDLIVIDHHMAEIALPEAVAVVDPNRLDDDSPHKQLAAVGVAFLLAVGVNRALREAGWYGSARSEPDLRQWLDLVALGTVCDVVPLTGVNRALVRQGLRVMAERGNIGLAALADVARLREPPGAYHLGFLLGPRVNAGGRVGQADLGARLLSSDDPHEVGALALRLDEFNAERRAIEREVLDQAIARIEGIYGPDRKGLPAALVVESEGWHVGVIGIVASRLVERYGRPAFVIGMDGGLGKGSGRSVQGRRSRRGGDRGAAGRACWSTAAATPWRRASPWPGSAADLARFLDERIAPQLGAAPAGARARHRRRPGAGCRDAGAGRHDRAGRPVRRRQCPAALRAHLGARQLRAAGGRGPCALHAGRRRARPHRGHRLPRRPERARPGAARSGTARPACRGRPAHRPLRRPRKRAPADRRCRPGDRLGAVLSALALICGPGRYMLPLLRASSPSSRGLGHRPFTAATRVRIP